MPRDRSFWRNLAIIGVAHIAVLTGVLRWSASAKKPIPMDILWMEGGVAEMTPVVSPVSLPAPALPAAAEPPFVVEEEPPPVEQTETDDPPILSAAKSEVELPTPTPPPTATPRRSVTSSPRASPKPTPNPTPKKTLVAKVSPQPTKTPSGKKATETKKVSVKAAPSGKGGEAAAAGSSSPAGASGVVSSGSGGSGIRGSGAGGASQFSWYGSMLHDRFFGEWAQPTSIAMSGARMSALVRIRIEKDGRISDFSIVRSSGNVVVDESVAEIAKRVIQVDPPPSALSDGGHYDVQINFELNPE